MVLVVVLLSLLATATFTALSMGHHARTTGQAPAPAQRPSEPPKSQAITGVAHTPPGSS